MKKELKEKILSIPEDGEFYKSSTEETFLRQGKFLKSKGLSDSEIHSLLEDLYFAVSNEYGN